MTTFDVSITEASSTRLQAASSSSSSVILQHLDADEMQRRLNDVLCDARVLRVDVDQLRQIHLVHVVAMNELLHDTFVKLTVSPRIYYGVLPSSARAQT